MIEEYYDDATVQSSRQKEELVAANAARWFQAASDGDVESMGELLALGFPIVAIRDDRTALHDAARSGNAEIIPYLVAAAVSECHKPMAEFLIGRCANISKGRLVSHAVQHCDFEMVELLLDKGADASKVDLVETDYGADWFTPLALARHLGREDIAELLISFGGHE